MPLLMSSTLKLFIAALAAAGLCAAQGGDCEKTCEPQKIAATTCTTMACYCYAYDDPDYVSCLRSECGKGFDSVREIQVQTCVYLGVTISPDPPTAAAGSDKPATTKAASNPQSTSGTTSDSGGGSGGISSGGSGGSSNTGDSGTPSSDSGSGSGSDAGSSPTPQASGGKDKLSTAELIGIAIGAVSAIATIVGVWVGIVQKRKKNRANESNAAAHPAYQPIPPPIQAYPSVHNIHVAPVFHHGPTTTTHGPAANYQSPPAYNSGAYNSDMGWNK